MTTSLRTREGSGEGRGVGATGWLAWVRSHDSGSGEPSRSLASWACLSMSESNSASWDDHPRSVNVGAARPSDVMEARAKRTVLIVAAVGRELTRRRIMGEEGGKHSCTVDASNRQSDKDRNRKLVGPWAGGGREAKGACICQPCPLCATTGREVSRK